MIHRHSTGGVHQEVSIKGFPSGGVHQGCPTRGFHQGVSIRRCPTRGFHQGVSIRRWFPSGGVHQEVSNKGFPSGGVHQEVSNKGFPSGGVHQEVSNKGFPSGGVHRVNSRLRSFAKPHRGEGRDTSSRKPQLKVTPAQVARVHTSKDARRGNEGNTAQTMYCWGSVGNKGSAGSIRNGRTMQDGFHSDDSDLSDQEKGGAEVQGWATPAAELRLRPEPFGSDLDPDSSLSVLPEAEYQYREVLPGAPNSLTRGLWEGEPLLAAITTRLSEIEALQTATVQRELTRTTRCRPVTTAGFTRTSPRPRKADFPETSWESASTGPVVSGLMKLSLMCDLGTRQRACALHKQNLVPVGIRQQPGFGWSCSRSTKLNLTETQGQSRGERSARKSRAGNKTRKTKANRGTFSSHRKPPPNSATKSKSSGLG
ncbi:hypothetical protein DPEC_G00054840 [Dallia pectoralis]|uniref:Uncharacterized protein n=1 Tax=Dallia pectoralis TaxID=75939 RepID=A0ACC2H5Q4_DALPE|nr:hypothetical protein DPEC_G00054840 [Dallia pectoralis]